MISELRKSEILYWYSLHNYFWVNICSVFPEGKSILWTVEALYKALGSWHVIYNLRNILIIFLAILTFNLGKTKIFWSDSSSYKSP